MKKLIAACCLVLFPYVCLFAADGEIAGQFEPGLVANTEDLERVILKSIKRDQLNGKLSFSEDAHIAAARITDPRSQKISLLTLLVEDQAMDPVIFVDLNGDNQLADNEKFSLKEEEEDNPYLWTTSVEIPLVEGPFRAMPIFIRYFKTLKMGKMGEDDRLIQQSTEVMARARASVGGKDVLFQYTYDAGKKKIDPLNGWLGVDTNGDGSIEIDNLSPESTKANEEAVVFRAGDVYVSTRKTDVSKNQIMVRQHQAKDYKRAEVWPGKEFPEFAYTDFSGGKHKFSELRGKYVLLDVWGFWCPACRDELPYLREANRRYAARGLVVLGLNTDEDYTIDSMKDGLKKAGMEWTHAQFASVADFLRVGLRVHSFPSTFLISPDGKVISMNRTEKKEKSLRGRELLTTLDDILPPM
jgi:thiol-disulfide isomerase/thioredoxin